jgi:hydroxyacylglutathione hydrolase
VTEGLLPPPIYFPQNVKMNKEGYESIEEVLHRGLQELTPEAFEAAANETGALILDTRSQATFAKGFIPNAINIGINGNFAPWVGSMIKDIKQSILIVAEPGREQEVVTRLARVGYDNAIGFLKDGFEAWKKAGKEIDQIESVSVDEFAKKYKATSLEVVDVRMPDEYAVGHVANAVNIPLEYMNDHMAEFRRDIPLYIHCAGGYRSMIAASILKSRGYEDVVNIEKGYKAIATSTDVPTVKGVASQH